MKALYDYVASTKPEEIKSLKLGRKVTRFLIEDKTQALAMLEEAHPSVLLKAVGLSETDKLMADLSRLMDIAVKEQAADIDTVVTTDIHRLIRLPNTLHGKTGWQCQTIPTDSLVDYDPLVSAIAFRSGEARLYVRRAPKIRIGDMGYGPYKDEVVTVPTAVAMFLLCKKGASVVA